MADSDVIEFECPRCLATVRVAQDQSGKRVDCPKCEGSLLVPAQSTSPDLFDDLFETKPTSRSDASVESTPVPPAEPTDLHPDIMDIDEDDLLSNIVNAGPSGAIEKSKSDSADLSVDPFKVDPDAPIKVDGMGDVFSHDDVYGIKCNICDTRIHVRPEQAGTHIKCPECFSKVLVKPSSEVKTKPPKWVQDGRGQSTNEPEEELKLSDPIERPEIDESFGLAPVTDDMLAPKPKIREEFDDDVEQSDKKQSGDEGGIEDGGFALAPLQHEIEADDSPLLELLDDDEPAPIELYEEKEGKEVEDGLELIEEPQSETPLPKSRPAKPKTNSPQQKSRKEKYEEAQRRQAAKEAGTAFRPAPESNNVPGASAKDRFPEFDFNSLLSSSLGMLRSPGVSWRVGIAIALMCLGSIMGLITWPVYVPAAEELEEAKTGMEKMWMGIQWTLFCVIPYMIGLAVLWYIAGYIFRDAALGHLQVKSWKSKGTNETMATVLVFGFSFFIGGLPAAFVPSVMMPLRFFLAPLFLLGAWYSKSAFGIINVDAFKNAMKHSGHWLSFYIFMGVIGLIGLAGGLMFELRRVVPYLVINAAISIVGVLVVAALTLIFAAVSGWNCGWVVADLEESS
ncbi:MAG: hypothetical protein AB8B55_01660 [Mariniblastus sp.]